MKDKSISRNSDDVTFQSNCWQQPDEPFHEFRASKTADRRILCCSRTLCDRFWSSKNTERLVGSFWKATRVFSVSIIIYTNSTLFLLTSKMNALTKKNSGKTIWKPNYRNPSLFYGNARFLYLLFNLVWKQPYGTKGLSFSNWVFLHPD